MQNGRIGMTIVKEVSTCTVAFLAGLNLFEDLSTVVDVGSSPTTSTDASTLAMLSIVVRYPDFTVDSIIKVRTPIYTSILMSKLARI